MTALPQPVPEDHVSSGPVPRDRRAGGAGGAALGGVVARGQVEERSPSRPVGTPHIGPAPQLDMAAAATTSFVMAEHQVGWHDIEDTVTVYHWVLQGSPGLPPGLTLHPTAGQAAAFLHGHRARQGRDVACDWCVSDLRRPRDLVDVDECAVATTRYVFAGHSPKGGETLEMLLVYLWVIGTSRPSYLGDGSRVYDQGEGAIRFLHAWRVEQGLEEPRTCAVCP